MNAWLRTFRPSRTPHDVARIVAMSLGIFGAISFTVNDGNTLPVWGFRFVAFGAAAVLYWSSRNSSSRQKATAPEFNHGVLVLAGQKVDPRTMTAAAVCPRKNGGIVHLWQGDLEAIITADAKMFAILCGALHPSVLRAPRTYHPSGTLRTIAQLDIEPKGLSFPTDWVRGAGMTRTERLAWKEVRRIEVRDGFLVIERKDGKLLGPGVSIAEDLERLIVEEIENMRSGLLDNPVPEEVLAALPRLASAHSEHRDADPYRGAPEIDDAGIFAALARGPVECRPLAAEVLVRRGVISPGAAAYIRRGLEKTHQA